MKKSKAEQLISQVDASAPAPADADVPEGFQVVSSGFELQEEGDVLQGEFIGAGPVKQMGKGKKKKPTPTFIVKRDDGAEVTVPLSAQLDVFIKARKGPTDERYGDSIFIKRGPQVKGGQGRVTTFTMAWKPGAAKSK